MIERYKVQAIENIWSDQNKFSIWLQIEKLNCAALCHVSHVLPPTDLKIIESQLCYDINDIYAMEKITKHDVIAFTRAISKHCQDAQKKWIHYGLTSSDIVDTANGVALQQTNEIILASLMTLVTTISNLAIKHKRTYCIGRTHGMHAEICSFGFKLIGWVDELKRQIARFKSACQDVEVCKISGAVGTYANTSPKIQDYIAKQLKLNSAIFSTQVISRDNHSFYFDVLKNIGLSINKFATELRHLHRTEVNEVSEYFADQQKGSSAMPHKKNPIGLENVCGLSRLLAGYSLVSNENVNLWHERDISHSSTERIMFIDATSTLVYILERFNNIMVSLIVNDQKMLSNIASSGTKIYSGQVLNYLVAHTDLSREAIYDQIQALIIQCNQQHLDFITMLKQHPLADYIDNFDQLVSLDFHMQHIDHIFSMVLNKKPLVKTKKE